MCGGFLPVAETKLVLALLLVHRAVAVQVVETPALLPALAGGGRRRRGLAVLLALPRLQDGGDVLPAAVARDVGHVLAPAGPWVAEGGRGGEKVEKL